MPTRAGRFTRHARIGRERSHQLLRRYGSEVRLARQAAGLTQRQLAALAGISQSFVSCVERALRRPDWSIACALAAATGHELGLRLFPQAGPTLRDSGQAEAVALIAAAAHASWHAMIEHPVGPGDRRAADLVLRGPEEFLHVEVERRLVDLQAQVRAAQLKRAVLQDTLGQPVRLVVAVPGTRAARRLLGDLKPMLDRALPAGSQRVWRSIRGGTPLGSDGVLLLPPRPRPTDHRGSSG